MADEKTPVTWEIRAARNQSLFRAINEELRVAGLTDDPKRLTIACECANTDCVETIELETDRYTEIRGEPTHFIVLGDHVFPEVERVVEDDPRFVVVEKLGEAASVAAAWDSVHGDA